MESESELRTWLWILKTWIVLYSSLLVIRVALGQLIGPTFFWISLLVGVPIVVVPVTYKSLVGGGCSIKYHICPLVKGILAGVIMFAMSVVADWSLNMILSSDPIWSAMYNTVVIRDPHQIWWFSGLAGGILTRIQEVRELGRAQQISIIDTE